jgi:phage baseplate assembly protein W
LFTALGERVYRPTFGSGINQLVFAPNNEELATATAGAIEKVDFLCVKSDQHTVNGEKGVLKS